MRGGHGVEPRPSRGTQRLFDPLRRRADGQRDRAEDADDGGRIPRTPLRDDRTEQKDGAAHDRQRDRSTRGPREVDRIAAHGHRADQDRRGRGGEMSDRLRIGEPEKPESERGAGARRGQTRGRMHARRHAELQPPDDRRAPRLDDDDPVRAQRAHEPDRPRAGRVPPVRPARARHVCRDADRRQRPHQAQRHDRPRHAPPGDPGRGRDARYRHACRDRRRESAQRAEHDDPPGAVRRTERRRRNRQAPRRERRPPVALGRPPRERDRQRRARPRERAAPFRRAHGGGGHVRRRGHENQPGSQAEQPRFGRVLVGDPGHRAKRSTCHAFAPAFQHRRFRGFVRA